jgi:hypothetical protein
MSHFASTARMSSGLDCRARLVWIIFVAALPLLVPSPARAQFERWGVKAGVSSMTGTGEALAEEGIGRNTGFLIGGTATIGLAGPLSLRPELLFVRKGWTFTLGDTGSTINLDYLELPVLADVEVVSIRGVDTHAQVGPTFGVMVNSNVNLSGDDGTVQETDPSDTLSRTEVGLAVGGSTSTEIGPRTVRLDVRYRLSLTNVNERRVRQADGTFSDSPTIRNRGLSISVGLVF